MDQATKDLLLARRIVDAGTAQEVREVAGLSRSEMAKAIGATPSAVKSWERGRRRPHGEKGAAYGAALRELMVGAT